MEYPQILINDEGAKRIQEILSEEESANPLYIRLEASAG